MKSENVIVSNNREAEELKGCVRIEVFDKSGKKVDFFQEDFYKNKRHVSVPKHNAKNLIVNDARKVLASYLQGFITTIKLGRNGHSGSDTDTPVPPSLGDTALNDPSPYSKAVSSTALVPTNIETGVKYTFNVDYSEGNGTGTEIYTEAGLFGLANKMFSRITFPTLLKNSDRKFTITWTINF